MHGGTTCGIGEFGDANKTHESCCKSLPVAGFTDPDEPGKAVYLDKYEITAGRMRAFVDAIAAANGGTPNIKGYIAAHAADGGTPAGRPSSPPPTPARWSRST